MDIITLALIWWLISYALERSRSGFRSARDRHANQIAAANPTWSKSRIRRTANRRAWGWWGHELANGFPTVRNSLGEDWEHIQHMRAKDRLDSERRRENLRDELDQLRSDREAHRELARNGETELSFPRWLDAGRPGLPTPVTPGTASTTAAPGPTTTTSTGTPSATGTAPGATSTGTPSATGTAPGATSTGTPSATGTAPGATSTGTPSATGTAPGVTSTDTPPAAATTTAEPAPTSSAAAPGTRHLRVLPDPEPDDRGSTAGADTGSATVPASAPAAPASSDGTTPAVSGSSAAGTQVDTTPQGDTPGAADTAPDIRPAADTPPAADTTPTVHTPAAADDRPAPISPAPVATSSSTGSATTAVETADDFDPFAASDYEPTAAANGGTVPSPRNGSEVSVAPAASTTPGQPDGNNHHGGSGMAESMEAPDIETARQVVSKQADSMMGVAANSEQLVNDLLAGGMGNDATTMAAVQRAQELTQEASAAWAAAHQGLQGHQDGEEYANNGKAADTKFLQRQ
jgi:hypothetical protein